MPRDKKAILKACAGLVSDLERMEKDDEYSIFDDWEIGEVKYLVEEVASAYARGKED